MEIFSIFAQSSIAIIAFTSIVVQFRRRDDPNWNPHLFSGMVNHAFFAFVGSCLPFILEPFGMENRTIWITSGWIVGGVTFSQGVAVMGIDKVSSFKTKVMMLLASTLVFGIQLANIFELGWKTNQGAYAIAVFWHIFQSLFIFALLIFPQTKEKPEVKEKENAKKYEKML